MALTFHLTLTLSKFKKITEHKRKEQKQQKRTVTTEKNSNNRIICFSLSMTMNLFFIHPTKMLTDKTVQMLVLSVPRYNILLFFLLFDLYLFLFIDTLIISQLFDCANHSYDYAWPRNFCRLVVGVVVCLSAKGLMSWIVVKRFISYFERREI